MVAVENVYHQDGPVSEPLGPGGLRADVWRRAQRPGHTPDSGGVAERSRRVGPGAAGGG